MRCEGGKKSLSEAFLSNKNKLPHWPASPLGKSRLLRTQRVCNVFKVTLPDLESKWKSGGKRAKRKTVQDDNSAGRGTTATPLFLLKKRMNKKTFVHLLVFHCPGIVCRNLAAECVMKEVRGGNHGKGCACVLCFLQENE